MLQSSDTLSRQSLLTRYLRTLLFSCTAVLLRLVVIAPLALFFVFPSGSPWRYLALLSPALMLFFLLPLRFSFAQAMVVSRVKKNLSFDIALGMRPYGEKLGEALLHALSVLKWGIPLALMVGYPLLRADYYMTGIGISALLDPLEALGQSATSFYAGISAFFGNAQALELSGGLMEGIYVVLGIFALGAVLLLYGIMRNSAYRYIWALATLENHSPRLEARKRLKGRRWVQLLVALLNLLLLLPFLVMALRSFKDVFGDLSSLGMMALSGNVGQLFDFGAAASPILVAFICLYLPLLPVRRMITAYFATAAIRPALVKAPKAAPIQTPIPAPAPAPVPAPIQVPVPVMQQSAAPEPAPAYIPTPAVSPVSSIEPAPELPPLEIQANPEEEQVFTPAIQDALGEPMDDRDPPTFTLGQ